MNGLIKEATNQEPDTNQDEKKDEPVFNGKTKKNTNGKSAEKKAVKVSFKRIFYISLSLDVPAIILIFLLSHLSKSLFYSILFLLGSIIGIAGFLLMIKMVDRMLKRGKGRSLFFLATISKMVVIGVVFYVAAQHSKTAVTLFMLGLSVIVAAIMADAVYQFYRSYSHGRT